MKTVLITGANAGLGFACARVLALRGWHVVLGCRSRERGEVARGQLGGGSPIDLLEIDVGDLASVRRAVVELPRLSKGPLSALVANAGIQVTTGRTTTPDGLELTFATNHLGHYTLARGLLPQMAQDGRIVFVSSNTHDPRQFTGIPGPLLDDVRSVAKGLPVEESPSGAQAAGQRRYSTSKLYNVLCAYELDRRLRAGGTSRVTVNAFDPGMMPGTALARDYGALSRFAWEYLLPALTLFVPNVNRVETSATRLAALVDAPEYAGVSGRYYSSGREVRSSPASYDEAKARELWEVSSELAGLEAAL